METEISEKLDGAGIEISVIVPVYNTMPYLTELMNSLEGQTMASERFEVIAVDDGSTDFSGEILDVYAKRNVNFRVIHQENSGWPGKPRNVGVTEAKGEYVFFCDGDDVLGSEALQRMASYAKANEVDVLIPKMVGLDGRKVMAGLYRTTRRDTPIEVALKSLNPIKLVRRSILINNNIKFREEPVRLEDGIMVTQTYMVSDRISILSDYDYYHARTRRDGKNISVRLIDPRGYVDSLTSIAQTIFESIERSEAQKLIADLFVRKGIRFYQGKRYLAYKDEGRAEWVRAHSVFLKKFLGEDPIAFFDESRKSRISAIVDGKVDELVSMAQAEVDQERRPELKRIELGDQQVTVAIQNHATQLAVESIVVEDRDTKGKTYFPIANDLDQYGNIVAVIPYVDLVQGLSRLGDVWLTYAGAHVEDKRVVFSDAVESTETRGIRFYKTLYGSFSIDVRKSK